MLSKIFGREFGEGDGDYVLVIIALVVLLIISMTWIINSYDTPRSPVDQAYYNCAYNQGDEARLQCARIIYGEVYGKN